MIVVLSSCVLASCVPKTAINGAGYQAIRFSSSAAARLASADETAGPAISSNNAQCMRDDGCRK